ncbi:uncharacterized protein Z520_10260 [Fonsecaea multimorphosa CBS 102226]|uniref:Uncharacterized protein n=1 Tax=Fonsecaea multimorphosa CBS 102226 TaxID=1442371 RepID=A0A0D2KBF5_9EURO|nr:uncharacterized protein Z520_10260 [Fonsecaea multimorphosa CBS 102226]KIX93923.1 hypothetical protein Z520_10260 [Fonsecaea multimorphosa CBS 102226]
MSSAGRTSVSSNGSASSIPEPAPRQVASVCYPKGKCMAGDGSVENAGESWTREVYGKMK